MSDAALRSDPAAYPPPDHLLRDLALSITAGDALTCTAALDVAPDLCGPSGAPRAGLLALAVDVVGGSLAAVAAQPDWIATADLCLATIGCPGAGRIEARGRVARTGRTTAVVVVDLEATDGRRAGVATMTFALLPRRDGNPVVDAPDAPLGFTFEPSGLARAHGLDALCGIETDGHPGDASLEIGPRVRNSLGGLQGGAIAILADRVAADAVAAAAGADAETVDLQISYLALGKVGPVVAHAYDVTVSRAAADVVPRHATAPTDARAPIASRAAFGTTQVSVIDHGAGGRRMATVRAVAVPVAVTDRGSRLDAAREPTT